MKSLAVEGLTLNSSSGNAQIVSQASQKVKATNGIYKSPLQVSINGASQGTCQNANGSGVISATATKVLIEGSPSIREGDTGVVVVDGTNSTNGSPCSFTVTVTVSDAGQNRTKGE